MDKKEKRPNKKKLKIYSLDDQEDLLNVTKDLNNFQTIKA